MLCNWKSAVESMCSSSEAFARIRHLESSIMATNHAHSSQLTSLFFRLNEIDDFIGHSQFIYGSHIEESQIKEEARRGIETHVQKLKAHTATLADALHQHHQDLTDTDTDTDSHESSVIKWKAEAARNLLSYLETNDIHSISHSEHQLILEALIDGASSVEGKGGSEAAVDGLKDRLQELKEKVIRGEISDKIGHLQQQDNHQTLLQSAREKREQARDSFDRSFAKSSHPSSHPAHFSAERQKAMVQRGECKGHHWTLIFALAAFTFQLSLLQLQMPYMLDEKWGSK